MPMPPVARLHVAPIIFRELWQAGKPGPALGYPPQLAEAEGDGMAPTRHHPARIITGPVLLDKLGR